MGLISRSEVFSGHVRDTQVHLHTFGGPWSITVENLYQAFKTRMLAEMKAESVDDDTPPDFHPV